MGFSARENGNFFQEEDGKGISLRKRCSEDGDRAGVANIAAVYLSAEVFISNASSGTRLSFILPVGRNMC